MLVYRDRYVEERRETYWITAQSFQEIQNVLTGQNFVARKIRSFRMVYCLPVHPTEDWLDCRRVLKYGCDSHTPNKFSIIHSDNEYKQNDAGGLTVTVAYRNAAPLLIPAHNETEAEIYLAAHGYRRWFAWDFLVHDFEHSDSGMKIAVDESGKTHTLRVDPAEMDHATIQTALATLLATPMNIQHTLFRATETTAGR